MRRLEYQVLFTEGSDYVLASVPDLRCEAVGPNRETALAAVERLAMRALWRYENTSGGLPQTMTLSLGRIELAPPPAPARRPGHIRLAQRAGHPRAQRQVSDALAVRR
jgi:hypothetical protein